MTEEVSAQNAPPLQEEAGEMKTIYLKYIDHRPVKDGEIVDIHKKVASNDDEIISEKVIARTAYDSSQTKSHKNPEHPRVPFLLRDDNSYNQDLRFCRLDLASLKKDLEAISERQRQEEFAKKQAEEVRLQLVKSEQSRIEQAQSNWMIPKPMFLVRFFKKIFSRSK